MTNPLPNFSDAVQPLKFGMDKSSYLTLHWACHYLSMLGLKLIHASKRGFVGESAGLSDKSNQGCKCWITKIINVWEKLQKKKSNRT